jgi:hypothetical protein
MLEHPMAQTIFPISPVTAPAYAAVALRPGCTARPELLRASKGIETMRTTVEELNEYGKRVEDVALALQKLAAAKHRSEAMTIRLVSYHHMRELVDMLRQYSCASAPEVYAAAAAILNGQRVEETAAEKPERVPVVIVGQGSSERRYYEEDFATRPSKAGPGAWARLRAFFGGSNNG